MTLAQAAKPQTSREQADRKQQVLTHGSPSAVHGISDALVIKDRDLFFLCEPDGEVPVKEDHGFGLYYNDCRLLRGYELRLAGDFADRLASSAAAGNEMSVELTNRELHARNNETVGKERVGVSTRRRLDGQALTLTDTIELDNFGVNPTQFPLDIRFEACFEDIFFVRGLLEEQPGSLEPPAWKGSQLHFGYQGADGLHRSLAVTFNPAPDRRGPDQAGWDINLAPQQHTVIIVRIQVRVSGEQSARSDLKNGKPSKDGRRGKAASKARGGSSGRDFAGIRSNSPLLDGIIQRSLRDLGILRSYNAGAEYYAAGVPWFVALFGRDSVITSIETLAYDATVAEQTLRVLADWQGTEVDEYRDEEPGKILHELRVGELARTGAVPHHPFYGSVDSTPLFLLLLCLHANATGRLNLFEELRPNVEAAIEWLDRYGDNDGDGFVDYRSSTGRGLVNQGWKDSGNGIVNRDGSLVEPPVALPEVQGYVYRAKLGMADLYERAGSAKRAAQLRREAEKLRAAFEVHFWLDDRGTYALALGKGGKKAGVVSSNPGQAVWTGIVSDERAASVRDSLMADDMFSGWGIRTLSSKELSFNPIGYHLGTVWPHDNALISAGFRGRGFDAEADRIALGIIGAAAQFPEYRLPEVFAGYERSRFSIPVHYPVACHPQAWAAGSVPYLLTTMLGIEIDGFARELRVKRPSLLPYVSWLEMNGIRVGDAQADLRFERTGSAVAVEVMRVEGELRVVVEPAPLREEADVAGPHRRSHEARDHAAGDQEQAAKAQERRQPQRSKRTPAKDARKVGTPARR